MKKKPWYYQLEAYKAIIKDIGAGNRPYASMCTGSGKALLCAMLAEKALKQGVRALILVPSSELCGQNYEEHYHYTDKKNALGICSAKLGKFEIHKQIVYATYTSFLRRRAKSGAFNLLVCDEAHFLNPDPETSYQKIIRSLLRLNPDMKICGMSATCYRMDQGLLHEDSIKGKAIFTNMCYETNIPELISLGYLSHVESISGDIEADMEGVKLSGMDYDTTAMAAKFDDIVIDGVKDMKAKFEAYNIQTAIIYASNLSNARRIIDEWEDGNSIRLAYGDMPNSERKELVKWLHEGNHKRYVVNVGLFVTGFNYPALDCVVLFLATKSLAKYVQICGRVIRAHDDKECGYVLDFGGNIERHGPIDATIPPKNKKRRGDAPKKICTLPWCGHVNRLSAKFCALCGGEFISVNEEGMYSMRSKAEILAAKREAAIEHYNISDVEYLKCYSRKDGTKMLKEIFYSTSYDGIPKLVYENYYMLEHKGFPKEKSNRMLMSMFKNPKDFYRLGAVGINVDNIYLLLTENPQFFKVKKAIWLKQGDGRYKELVKIEYS